jgi:CubicO group peptidase (beta-lactamase class C family)
LRLFRLSLVLATLAPSLASAATPADDNLNRCIETAAARQDLSGSILVSRGDQVIARIERGRLAGPQSPPITASTRFNLASASKMFTAVAIGQLIDAGKLRLDQPIGDVVPGIKPEAARVTIRQLLTHSSGLGDFFHPENMTAILNARRASDILPLIAGERPTFSPGSRFAYSNTGFALLGIAIERISGLTYGEYLRRHIFGPAGMISTGPDPKPLSTLAVGLTALDPESGSPGLVLMGPAGHSPGSDPVRAPATLRPAPGAVEGYGTPAGGLFGTADDMQRFATALLADRLLSPATRAAFTSAQIEASPASAGRPARHYGFGFGITDDAGKHWFGHNGGTLGANAEFLVRREDRWVVSVLSNRDPPMATGLLRGIRAMIDDPARIATCQSN